MNDPVRDTWVEARRVGVPPAHLLLHGIPLDERASWLHTLQDIETSPETSA